MEYQSSNTNSVVTESVATRVVTSKVVTGKAKVTRSKLSRSHGFGRGDDGYVSWGSLNSTPDQGEQLQHPWEITSQQKHFAWTPKPHPSSGAYESEVVTREETSFSSLPTSRETEGSISSSQVTSVPVSIFSSPHTSPVEEVIQPATALPVGYGNVPQNHVTSTPKKAMDSLSPDVARSQGFEKDAGGPDNKPVVTINVNSPSGGLATTVAQGTEVRLEIPLMMSAPVERDILYGHSNSSTHNITTSSLPGNQPRSRTSIQMILNNESELFETTGHQMSKDDVFEYSPRTGELQHPYPKTQSLPPGVVKYDWTVHEKGHRKAEQNPEATKTKKPLARKKFETSVLLRQNDIDLDKYTNHQRADSLPAKWKGKKTYEFWSEFDSLSQDVKHSVMSDSEVSESEDEFTSLRGHLKSVSVRDSPRSLSPTPPTPTTPKARRVLLRSRAKSMSHLHSPTSPKRRSRSWSGSRKNMSVSEETDAYDFCWRSIRGYEKEQDEMFW